jgi:hypothetical protein
LIEGIKYTFIAFLSPENVKTSSKKQKRPISEHFLSAITLGEIGS